MNWQPQETAPKGPVDKWGYGPKILTCYELRGVWIYEVAQWQNRQQGGDWFDMDALRTDFDHWTPITPPTDVA